MEKLLSYLRGYRLQAILAPLFKMLEATLELFVPLIMADLIDVGIARADKPYIWSRGLLLVILGVVGLALALTAQYFAAVASMGFGTALRKAFYAHINSLSHRELDTFGVSSLTTRLTSDINAAQTGVNLVLRLFLRAPFIVAGSVIMVFFIHKGIALLFLGVTLLLGGMIYLIVSRSLPLYKSAQKKLDHVALLTREGLSGARVIRAFGRQKEAEKTFSQSVGNLQKTQEKAGAISALMNPLTYVTINLSIVFLLWEGGKLVDSSILTQGQLIALINYMSQSLLALIALATLVVTFSKAQASAGRISEVLETPSSIQEPAYPVEPEASALTGQTPLLVFDHVSFGYHRSPVLSQISFTLWPGETLGIIGGTGAGKSTLLSLIPRFYDVKEGEIRFMGKPLQSYSTNQLRQAMGIVPQQAILFRGTIRNNMAWGNPNASDEDIWAALSTAQAADFIKALPEGLDAHVSPGGRNFSGGQRQRLTIARALVRRPNLLILDDSASALDYATDARLRKALRRDLKDTTVILISQRAFALRQADRILVLEDGHIAGEGTHAFLMANCPPYQEIVASQEGGNSNG